MFTSFIPYKRLGRERNRKIQESRNQEIKSFGTCEFLATKSHSVKEARRLIACILI